jgi:hypothetical protein
MMAHLTPFTPSTMPTTMDTEDEESSTSSVAVSCGNGKRRATPFDLFRQGERKTIDDDDVVDEFIMYNETLASKPYCLHRVLQYSKKEKNCQCLHVLGESVFFCEAVGQYQLFFSKLKRSQQQIMLMFPIPFIVSDDDCTEIGHLDKLRKAKICRDALMDILGLGKLYWSTCVQHAMNNTIPAYKLKGKKTYRKLRWDAMYFDSLVEHFEELRKEAGPRIATRFVREKTGETTTRDDNEKVECLPPSFSKRMMLFNANGTEGSLQEAVAARLDLLQRADILDSLPFKGIPEFQQVQLNNNYRKFIPGFLQDEEICPKPCDEVLKRQKDDQKRQADVKKDAKPKKLKDTTV